MLDAALEGRFRESDYNETELSRLETKWMRFLSISALNREKLDTRSRALSRDWSLISPTKSKLPSRTSGCMKTFLMNVWKGTTGN